MNTRSKKSIFWRSLTYFFILGIALALAGSAEAFAQIPFLGNLRAVDVDGSYMLLNIGGPPNGPFRITWVDDYMTFCSGEAGIIRGTGTINEFNVNLLEAELVAECFTSGDSLAFHMTFRYHPLTRTLSSQYENGRMIIWRRSGIPLEVPSLSLRVNYGDDWVESFYEEGHTAWVTVTESDGWTVKATAEVVTAPRKDWGGEPGFQTTAEDWLPEQPDIQPGDWVYGWVDNGASAQVQIGEISGKISLLDDAISGTISAPFFSEVGVECFPWGAPPEPPVDMKYDTVLPDGVDTYSCSWLGEWDITPYVSVGVGYIGLDGAWVATTFYAPDPRIVASESGDWFWTAGFYPGMLDISIYVSDEDGADLLWSGQAEAGEDGFAFVGWETHEQDLVEGNYLVVSDGVNTKDIVLSPLWVTVFDPDNEIMAGYAPAGSKVWAAAGPMEWQERLMAMADSETGWWLADFNAIGFDIDEAYRESSFAHIYDEDGDANEGSTPPSWLNPHFTIFPEWELYDAMDWSDGAWVTITVVDKEDLCTASQQSFGFFFNGGFPEGCDVEIGDTVRMTDGYTTREHEVQNLAVNGWDVEDDTLSGLADPGAELVVWVHEHDESMVFLVAGGDGAWTADFASVGFDLDYEMSGRAMIYGEMGNATAVDWSIPEPPHMWIWIEWNSVDGHGWGLYEDVTLTINDGEHVLIQNTGYGTSLSFDVGAVGHDIVPGDMIVMTNGVVTKEMLVPPLAITDFDLEANTVSGTGDPGLFFFTYVDGQPTLAVTWTDDTWVALFTDLLEEQWGDAVQVDGDNDAAAATIHTVGE
jgi:hypothetical protein